ncbi:hypothetical protein TI06_14910 [Vibrio vulnificus]|nr:hypothetical protein TI06_14910 [Vibrio vulnificus]
MEEECSSFFDQQPRVFLLKVFKIWFNFSINFFKSKAIFVLRFWNNYPSTFLMLLLPSYDTLFFNIFRTKPIYFF